MKVLVVGGTGFLGAAMVDAARARGHDVTVLARGRTARPVPPRVEALAADRHRDLSVLRGRAFDLAVDTCAYEPDAVAALLDALEPSVGRYALVSSISAYADFATPGTDETFPTGRATEEQLATARSLPPDRRSRAASYGAAYGPLKRACELVALDRLGERALILRAGLLVGAGDDSDRLTYWVRRIDRGGTVACPGDPARPVQFIDARDVARWTIHVTERGVGGVFNVTGQPFPMGVLLEACRRAARSSARLVWVPEERVLEAGIVPWSEMPVWVPYVHEASRHLLQVSVDKALAQGLETRLLEETLGDILAWDRTRGDAPLCAGLSPDKEAALLRAVA